MKIEKNNELVLITGASGTAGWALAGEFAANGHPLVITSPLRAELYAVGRRLAKTHGVEVIPIVSDFLDPRAPEEIHAEVERRRLPVHTLVNCVEGWCQETLPVQSPDGSPDTIRANMESTVRMTKLFLPAMLQQGSGRILNVLYESILNHGRLLAANGASKSFLLWFTDALRATLRGSNVTVQAILCSAVHPFCFFRNFAPGEPSHESASFLTPVAETRAAFSQARRRRRPSNRLMPRRGPGDRTAALLPDMSGPHRSGLVAHVAHL
jgi:short-subunit dehydrogenase